MKRIRSFRKLYVVVMEKDGYYIDLWENITGDIPGIAKAVDSYYSDAIHVYICEDKECAEKVSKIIAVGHEIAKNLLP